MRPPPSTACSPAPVSHPLHCCVQAEINSLPTRRLRSARPARPTQGGFEVSLSDSESARGRRLLLAYGVVDELPQIDGLRELWGTSVLHCPHCHGWEVRDEPLAAYGRGDVAMGLCR